MISSSLLRALLKWVGTIICLAVVFLLAYGFQHTTSLTDNKEFEIRLIADHLIVFWGPSTSWQSLRALSWHRGPYSCSWPIVILFSPGPQPPISSVPIPLWGLLAVTGVPTALLWRRRRSHACSSPNEESEAQSAHGPIRGSDGE
jgi:hypothetical protein